MNVFEIAGEGKSDCLGTKIANLRLTESGMDKKTIRQNINMNSTDSNKNNNVLKIVCKDNSYIFKLLVFNFMVLKLPSVFKFTRNMFIILKISTG